MLTTIQPGTYTLTQDCPNPNVDKRKTRDWRYFETIPKDTKFIVTLHKNQKDLSLDTPDLKGYSIDTQTLNSYTQKLRLLWNAIILRLTPIPETFDTVSLSLDFAPLTFQPFVEFLIQTNKITLEQFKQWAKEYKSC